ncbi:MAG: hypothetical protein RL171_1308, partial [Pseudomonadota bacterium]
MLDAAFFASHSNLIINTLYLQNVALSNHFHWWMGYEVEFITKLYTLKPMESYLLDWANLLLRWVHVITAIAWVGSSFYFVFLDNNLLRPKSPDLLEKGVDGAMWAVHGGGFYNPQKYMIAPKTIHSKLHWFYWESYSTWLTGFALFTVLYLYNASTYLIDKSLMNWSPGAAVGVALSFLVVFWMVYDAVCQLFGFRKNGELIVGIVMLCVVTFASWLACQWFAGRAAFLLVGAGMQTTQTAGLALATDLADAKNRPRVVAMMYVMLLFGMVLSGVMFSIFLDPFSPIQLIKVIQGVALITLLLNLFALWKQEARQPKNTAPSIVQPKFSQSWSEFIKAPQVRRFLIMLGLGTTAFSMQDIILEPYGGEILLLDVSATSFLTALIACGSLLAFTLSARWLSKGYNAYRISAAGLLLGLIAFSMVIFSEPLGSPNLFRLGALLIGFGGGLFAVSTLT